MQDTKLEHPSTRREISGAVWSLASNLLSRGTGIIFTPIFTRILSPSEFGVYSLYTSLLGIFTVICTFEISGSAIYKCFMKYSGTSSSDFTSVAMGAESTLALLSLTVYLIFRKNIDVICNLSYPLPAILIFQIFTKRREGG